MIEDVIYELMMQGITTDVHLSQDLFYLSLKNGDSNEVHVAAKANSPEQALAIAIKKLTLRKEPAKVSVGVDQLSLL